MADTNTTTYDLPNYIGELFEKGQRPNALLQMIGGINSYRPIKSTEFSVGQQFEVPDHTASRARLEGADAPDHAGVKRSQITNVTQIVQESVVVSYTKEGASQQLSGVNLGGATDPVQSELDFQTGVKLEFIARNLNWSFLNQTYQKPADNSSPRRTRGLLSAITTNVVSAEGEDEEPGPLSLELFDDVMAMMIASGAIADGDNVIALANTAQLRKLNELFRKEKIKVDAERFIGGVRVRTVYTTFGVLNFALEHDMPQDQIAIVNFDAIGLVATEIPGKGVLFREELAKTGANYKYQIYGELGLDHGPEWLHGKITDLATS